MNIGIVSLGCAKNLVDSEVMIGLLRERGAVITPKPEEADVIIVNTCSFIEPAKKEAIETILEMAQMKEEGQCRLLIVTGCLAQEHGYGLVKEIPEIDAVVGTGGVGKIADVIERLQEGRDSGGTKDTLEEPTFLYDHTFPRIRTTPHYLGYIKIAEGCDHHCSYCIIPRLRGRYRSREPESIIKEAQSMLRDGVKEICIIAQDTTGFGKYHQDENFSGSGAQAGKGIHLPGLLESLARLEGSIWIRVLYTYPFSVNRELIELMSRHKNIAPYLDIPLQHTHPAILKAMNRPADMGRIEEMIQVARSIIPDITIRTTFMVGFPGEGEEEFLYMLDFIKRWRFDHLGVFRYSRERGTPAFNMPHHVPKRIKEKRYNQIMKAQATISEEKNRAMIGKIVEVICDREDSERDDRMIGRTKGQSPDIDGVTYIKGKGLMAGEIYPVRITDADVYDLEGIVESSHK